MSTGSKIVMAMLSRGHLQASATSALRHTTAWQREWDLTQRLLSGPERSSSRGDAPGASGQASEPTTRNTIGRELPTGRDAGVAKHEAHRGSRPVLDKTGIQETVPGMQRHASAQAKQVDQPLSPLRPGQLIRLDSGRAAPPSSPPQAAIPWGPRRLQEPRPYSLHAFMGHDGVRVWVRDAKGPMSHGAELLAALKRAFSSSGLKLAQLILNGETIYENAGHAPVSDEPEYRIDKPDLDQSY